MCTKSVLNLYASCSVHECLKIWQALGSEGLVRVFYCSSDGSDNLQAVRYISSGFTIKITRVVNLPLEFWTVGCRKLIMWWPKEVVTWHKKVVMWFVWNGLTVMAFNKEGWFYERGKGPSEELKEQIIDKILETGGDGRYWDTFLQSERNLAINLVFLIMANLHV